jgi:hypothetical protein
MSLSRLTVLIEIPVFHKTLKLSFKNLNFLFITQIIHIKQMILCITLFGVEVLRFELRVLHLLGRGSIT